MGPENQHQAQVCSLAEDDEEIHHSLYRFQSCWRAHMLLVALCMYEAISLKVCAPIL